MDNVNTKISEATLGENALDQTYIGFSSIQTDGTDNKKQSQSPNATLGAFLVAVARAAANGTSDSGFISISRLSCEQDAPVPMMNILNGGRHADNTVDLQEFMINAQLGASCFFRGNPHVCEIYQSLRIF